MSNSGPNNKRNAKLAIAAYGATSAVLGSGFWIAGNLGTAIGITGALWTAATAILAIYFFLKWDERG